MTRAISLLLACIAGAGAARAEPSACPARAIDGKYECKLWEAFQGESMLATKSEKMIIQHLRDRTGYVVSLRHGDRYWTHGSPPALVRKPAEADRVFFLLDLNKPPLEAGDPIMLMAGGQPIDLGKGQKVLTIAKYGGGNRILPGSTIGLSLKGGAQLGVEKVGRKTVVRANDELTGFTLEILSRAWTAGNQTPFDDVPITDIFVSSQLHRGVRCPPGLAAISTDLNQGARGDWTYFCVEQEPGHKTGRPVTGIEFEVVDDERDEDDRTCSETRKDRIGSLPDCGEANPTRIDLNRCTRVHNKYIYACVRRGSASNAIRHLYVATSKHKPEPRCKKTYTRGSADLNDGAHGRYIRACWTR